METKLPPTDHLAAENIHHDMPWFIKDILRVMFVSEPEERDDLMRMCVGRLEPLPLSRTWK